MPSNARFLYDDEFDDCTTNQITASSEYTWLPAPNAVNEFRGRVWRTSAGVLVATIAFDLGAAAAVTQCAMFGHNLTSGATVIIEGNVAAAWPGAWDTTLVINATHDKANVYFASQNFQHWRLSISDAGNTNNYVEVGRVLLGAYDELSQNFRQNWSREMFDASQSDQAEGLQTYHNVRDVGHKLTMGWTYLGTTAREELETIFAAIGTHAPVVVGIDPDNEPVDWTHYVELKTPLKNVFDLLHYSDVSGLSFEEIF